MLLENEIYALPVIYSLLETEINDDCVRKTGAGLY